MTSEATQLVAALGIAGDTVEIKSESIKIQPLTINQIANIMLAIERLSAKGIQIPTTTDGELPNGFSAMNLILKGGAEFREILALASEQSEDFVGALNFVDASRLAGKIWTVNKDFFDQNRLEILKAFGLDETAVAGITNLVASLKSLATSTLEESPTSEALPSVS